MHFLCRGTLEVTRGDVGGLSPPLTHLQLDLIPEITHLQLEDLLATSALEEIQRSKGARSSFFKILEGSSPLSKEDAPQLFLYK